MLLKVNNVRIPLVEELSLKEATAKKLGLKKQDIENLQIVRRAVDARRKNNIILNYHVLLELDLSKKQLGRLLKDKDISQAVTEHTFEPVVGSEKITGRPIVIGAGPAGLLAALELAKHGYRPLLLERGKPVAQRIDDVQRFWQRGEFDPNSNVQFGEGGAGTFSDGKLTTRVNDPVMGSILQDFVKAGAPQEILYEHKPHVGTDKLRLMVNGLAGEIRALGGEIRYNAHVVDFLVAGEAVSGVQLADGEKINSNAVVLACGHSARDTYTRLAELGVGIEAKPFAIGVRIEHPQELIDRAQYGEFAGHPRLGVADYALVHHLPDKTRTAYSFCMCPGGVVVAAASEVGGVVVNGMSMYQRDSGIANSALVVNVSAADFGGGPLAGIEFQRRYERLAFAAAGSGYNAPAQNAASFLQGLQPELQCSIAPTYRPGLTACDLNKVLPDFVTATLRAGITAFDNKIKGFADGGALLTGVETRTSAPVRILRVNENKMSVTHTGLYPCGEGAGYAGGIMSAALDGYHVARAIMAKFAPIC
ncbi:FAD-dependent oxidoreductase [uncultured Phascolarctobacterium sp.]|uniref:NAD(P)/FAD-dependent oxidoreductase n=1 Tax=Phascolarctobacterium sp. TaxID=2049039 RepID=UPI0025EAA2FF|nr:FAD-dependent oxidoreductase [uncultured Phascolarctobacterium sp.]